MPRLFTLITAAAAAVLLSGGCRDGGNASVPADALVDVDGSILTRSEVDRHIRAGLSAEDSAEVSRAYIRSWIDARLIEGVVSTEVDMAEIDRLTAEYRSELIMAQYRRSMAMQASDGIFSDDTLRAFYESHLSDYVLERPILKGIYLKVPEDAPKLKQLRRLYTSEKSGDIDRLEKEALGSAIHYDYFRDTWIDRQQIETRIPIDFTDAVLESIARQKPLDVKSDGFVYLLSISDYLPAGATMPFEAARPLVKERILAARRVAYDTRLRNDLLNKSVSDGTVRFFGANPLK